MKTEPTTSHKFETLPGEHFSQAHRAEEKCYPAIKFFGEGPGGGFFPARRSLGVGGSKNSSPGKNPTNENGLQIPQKILTFNTVKKMKKLIALLSLPVSLALNAQDPQSYLKAIEESYHGDFTAPIELLYGSDLLSQGGYQSIDSLLAPINLTSQTRILDVGSGLGGPAVHIAKNYPAQVIGIDPSPSLIERSNQLLKRNASSLKGSADFLSLKDPFSLSLFNDNSFDVVFSKETLLHIPVEKKLTFFKEINRVLKPGGQLIVMDWLRTDKPYGPQTQRMFELDAVPFNMITKEAYLDTLKHSNFSNISYKETTNEHLEFTNSDIDRLNGSLKEQFIQNFGTTAHQEWLDSWFYQQTAFKNREIITAVLTATK